HRRCRYWVCRKVTGCVCRAIATRCMAPTLRAGSWARRCLTWRPERSHCPTDGSVKRHQPAYRAHKKIPTAGWSGYLKWYGQVAEFVHGGIVAWGSAIANNLSGLLFVKDSRLDWTSVFESSPI